ncbi:peptidylprolyl isomerase [Methanoplanus limicola]|uniref:peptidylprolyl isomerase n=1 Tax=Methanoplanus limicola DSM 2279 TaxID=937775 RepID=H1Z1Y2_9EURY|nr:peptidylprolyl isomerase [Methanoplanus limicola]EHQ35449.1 peptidyl-prolyl cis-trans isomerase cyclophilin type [Methanoplanus limicola DSM 2279]
MSKKVKFETNHGEIIITLYDDMPVTTGNFEKLVSEGFYDGIIFHRVINGFMIQAGCPRGTGTGGPGYNIKDEFVKGHSNVKGTLAMANTGQPNTGGSQFFINLVNNNYLDWDNTSTPYKHPVFGEVSEGMDVVNKIAKLPTDRGDKPKKEAKIIKATLIEE